MQEQMKIIGNQNHRVGRRIIVSVYEIGRILQFCWCYSKICVLSDYWHNFEEE